MDRYTSLVLTKKTDKMSEVRRESISKGAFGSHERLSWKGNTHLMTNTTGVRNATGQRSSAVTEVVLVYSPVFVLVPSTA